MKLAYAAVLAIVAAGSASLVAQSNTSLSGPRRDGRWEVTTEMQMPGMPNMPNMPGMSMPPMKSTQCITKEDAADPSKALPSAPQRGGAPSDCKMTDQKIVGNKVTWTMVCTGANPMTGTGEIEYAGDAYNGVIMTNAARGNQSMAMTIKISGKRLGDCVK